MRIDRPGIFPDISPADYFADPCPTPSLTQSLAKTLLDYSPAHARLEHPRLVPPTPDDEPEKYDAAKAIGNAAHLVVIGRGRDLAIGPWSDWRTKDAQTFRRDNEAAGKTAILEKHHDRARQMVIAASYQLDALGLREAFRIGQGEVMIAWQEDGLWFRSLIDWLRDTTLIFDYKSTGLSCAPHAVEDRPSVLGWDIQAAMHERGLDVLDPGTAGRRRHLYINQENEPPYALSVVEIGEADMTLGRKKLDMAIGIWRECAANGRWPMYPAEIIASRPRGWLETKWLEREVAHHERREAPRKREPMLTDLSGA